MWDLKIIWWDEWHGIKQLFNTNHSVYFSLRLHCTVVYDVESGNDIWFITENLVIAQKTQLKWVYHSTSPYCRHQQPHHNHRHKWFPNIISISNVLSYHYVLIHSWFPFFRIVLHPCETQKNETLSFLPVLLFKLEQQLYKLVIIFENDINLSYDKL